MIISNRPVQPLENPRKSTTGTPDFPAHLKPEEVVLQITTTQATQYPHFELIHTATLYDGPMSFKVAAMFEVKNSKTQAFHHYSLDIYSLQKRKPGYFFTHEHKFNLSGEKGEIGALYKFLSLFVSKTHPKEKGTYCTVPIADLDRIERLAEDNVQDLVQTVLENPEAFDELVKVGGKNLFKALAAIARQNNESVSVLTALIDTIKDLEGSEKVDVLNAIRKLNLSKSDLDVLSGRKEALEVFKQNLFSESDWTEKDWQSFFEQNTWIFGYGLYYRFLRILQREARVSGINVAGDEIVISDFLLGDANFTVLVELKRPDTPLFGRDQNRAGSWCLSHDLTYAMSQIMEQKAEWLVKSKSKQYDSDKNLIRQETIDPKAILIIGCTDQFTGDNQEQEIKRQTFEMYRRNSKDIEILTFDELFARANFIINHNK